MVLFKQITNKQHTLSRLEATEAIMSSVDNAAIELSETNSPQSPSRKRSSAINLDKFTVSVKDLNKNKLVEWLAEKLLNKKKVAASRMNQKSNLQTQTTLLSINLSNIDENDRPENRRIVSQQSELNEDLDLCQQVVGKARYQQFDTKNAAE